MGALVALDDLACQHHVVVDDRDDTIHGLRARHGNGTEGHGERGDARPSHAN